MKRIILMMALGFTLFLAACSAGTGSVQTAGHWQSEVDMAGASAPLEFTVGPDGEVHESNFDFYYEEEGLVFSVTSRSSSDSLMVRAEATSELGSITFSLDGTVVADTMTGSYLLSVTDIDGRVTAVREGSFTVTRT